MEPLVTHAISGPAPAGLWSVAPSRPVSRNPRTLLVAVATGGGENVDRNFEDAEAFLLYEKNGHHTCYIGRQPCPLATLDGDRMRRTRLLTHCDLVLCANISDTCKQTLSNLGIDCNLAYAGASVGDAVAAL